MTRCVCNESLLCAIIVYPLSQDSRSVKAFGLDLRQIRDCITNDVGMSLAQVDSPLTESNELA